MSCQHAFSWHPDKNAGNEDKYKLVAPAKEAVLAYLKQDKKAEPREAVKNQNIDFDCEIARLNDELSHLEKQQVEIPETYLFSGCR